MRSWVRLLSAAVLSLVFAGVSAAHAGQVIVLRVRPGQDFRALESKTLASEEGSVYVSLALLEEPETTVRSRWILEGTWGQIPFRGKSHRFDSSPGVSFEAILLKSFYPCGEAHSEILQLRVAPQMDGNFELLGATLITERSADTCHLSTQVHSVELVKP